MTETLPIDSHIAELKAAAREKSSIILKAEPGAGKTTRVPPALLDVVSGRIVVLEPRRLAARLSAERVAFELQSEVGGLVGYQIRFDSKVSAATRVNFVTEGLFLRMVQDQPELPGISAVILDEFHERHLHTDVALAIVRKLQQGRRRDLKLIVMSATLDTAALERYLPEARVFDVPGRTYPVRLTYRPDEKSSLEAQVGGAARELLKDPACPGNILVFLTGIQEIRRTADYLAPLARELGAEVLPLSAELPAREQARVFARSATRKIILSTNVAETSLTLPNITGVIDSGKAKIAAHASWSGMPTLDVKRISQASAIQRAGRAGRTAPGIAVRLYSEADYLARQAFNVPDIQRLDLAETMLDILALAKTLGDPPQDLATALPWFETPDAKTAASAKQLLVHLGVIDESLAVTPLGMKIAKIPLSPRLAAIIVKGQELGIGPAALAAACLVSERMILNRSVPAAAHEECDVRFQLDVLVQAARGGEIRPRVLADAVDFPRVHRIKALYENLAQRLRIPGGLEAARSPDPKLLSQALLAGFPDRVAKKRTGHKPKNDREPVLYNFCMGRGGILADSSVVKNQDLILALDAAENQSRSADRGTIIFVAAQLDAEVLATSPAPLVSERVETVWMEEAQRVDVMERRFYGELVVKETRAVVTPSHQAVVEELLRQKLAERWPKPFDDATDLSSYHVRARLLKMRHPDVELPVFEGEMLELLQAQIVEGKRSFKDIAERSLLAYLEDQLPYDQAQLLKKELPLQVTLQNGKVMRVHYQDERPAYVSAHIQDFYGIAKSPTVNGGTLPLTVELLGPNKRPLQVTGDLAGFWQKHYPPIRADLGRNYPRHYWPPDPTKAQPFLHKSKAVQAGQPI